MKGIVVWWPFEQGAIPHGWHECDGTLGTPDYRGRVLIGANATYIAGTTGGGETHGHDLSIAENTDNLAEGTALVDAEGTGDFSASTGGHGHDGTADAVNHMPPWAAGYWIQKL